LSGTERAPLAKLRHLVSCIAALDFALNKARPDNKFNGKKQTTKIRINKNNIIYRSIIHKA
jgi:hypothetical protein